MKNKLQVLFAVVILAIIATAFIGTYDTKDYTLAQPRMRVNRSATLTLSTTWQTVDFSGTSTYNTNSYNLDPTTGNPMVWWDATNKLFKFYDLNDQNYTITMQLKTSATVITTRATLQYRFVIPNGISTGVPLYFPFPDDQTTAYADLMEITILSGGQNNSVENISIYSNNAVRTNGLYLQVRLSGIVLGTASLTGISFLVQSSK